MPKWSRSTTRFRIPLTIALLSVLFATAVQTETYSGPLDEASYQAWGSSPALLRQGEGLRLLTSMAFTSGGSRFYLSAFMLAIGVGAAESIYGSCRAFGTFFGVHLLTLLTLALVIAIGAEIGSPVARTLYTTIDVGPSAGYYGCLGLVIASRKLMLRKAALIAIILMLGARLCWSGSYLPEQGRMLSADVAHAMAFPLGYLSARLRTKTAQNITSPRPESSS